MKIAVVVGNPKANSRTLGVANRLAEVLAGALPVKPDMLVVDLAEHAGDMFDWSSATLTQLSEQVASSDILIAASPTYKGSYTGLLKAFLDRYPSNGLGNVVAIALMTGAIQVHALAVEVHLRPLLVDLGSTVPARGLYVTEAELGDVDTAISRWLDPALPLIRRAVGLVGES